MNSLLLGAIFFSIWFTTLFVGKNVGLSMLLYVIPITIFITRRTRRHT